MIGARVPDWETKLSEFICANRNKPFKRGSFDCCQFCIKAESILHGETNWSDFIGGYDDLKGAIRKIKAAGADSLWELVDQRLERKPVLMAQRGDLIGHEVNEGQSLGIMDANGFWATAENGLEFINIDQAKVAWSL